MIRTVVLFGATVMIALAWHFWSTPTNAVSLTISDASVLKAASSGDFQRIPIRVVNRSNQPARIVGSNAC